MTVTRGIEDDVQGAGVERGWGALCFVVLAVLSFVVFLVVPYYVNNLDQYSLAEVSGGGHDPAGLWPAAGGGPLAIVFWPGGLLTIFLAPVVLAIGGMWALIMAIAQWRALDRAGRVLRLATVALAVAAGLWVASPLVQALIAWFLD